MDNDPGRDILLLSGYVCVDTVGDFCIYTDLVAGGLDIICHPDPNPDLKAVYYVCGRSGNSRIFPILDVREAIRHSRFLSGFYDRKR